MPTVCVNCSIVFRNGGVQNHLHCRSKEEDVSSILDNKLVEKEGDNEDDEVKLKEEEEEEEEDPDEEEDDDEVDLTEEDPDEVELTEEDPDEEDDEVKLKEEEVEDDDEDDDDDDDEVDADDDKGDDENEDDMETPLPKKEEKLQIPHSIQYNSSGGGTPYYDNKAENTFRRQVVVKRIQKFAKIDIFKIAKFITGEKVLVQVMKLVEKNELGHHIGTSAKGAEFRIMYKPRVMKSLNDKRGSCAQAGGKIVHSKCCLCAGICMIMS